MRVAEGPDACDQHDWVEDDNVMTSDEAHVARVCRCCSAVAVIGPDLPFDEA
ncbi:hypothetical protein ACOCJ5_04805 [Knoellia sp. CPCC 206450]|uniref:hypothetical protein n=1 Tax=Knoellia tibetensis TaxID=3404798 RepID=UPI003B433F2A